MEVTRLVLHFLAEHMQGIGITAAVVFCAGLAHRRRRRERAKGSLPTDIPRSLHPLIDLEACAGCGACTKVCPEGDVLAMVARKPVLVNPLGCVGHGECQVACPFDAITLVFGTKTRGVEIPNLTSEYETSVKGVYIAGELGGMGLIRNAIKQGQLAAAAACREVAGGSVDFDVVVVGSGPAGLAAALKVREEKKSYVVLEQGSFGGAVANFPRQKVVMSAPAHLPGVGLMKFRGNQVSKEELLEFWGKVRREKELHIRENTRFLSFRNDAGRLTIETSAGPITAHRLILCIGVRGTPRRLGIPGENLPKVTYNLLDPEQYQGKRIVVVGGGNSAAEAAFALCDPKLGNEVFLSVKREIQDTTNETNRKITAELVAAGRLQLAFRSWVSAVDEKTIRIEREDGAPIEIENDFLFIFAGAELPTKMLLGLGIQMDVKYGEPLRAA